MKERKAKNETKGKAPPMKRAEQPLLRVLVAAATRRGDTLAELARRLGVTYERLAQWRRHESDIGNAHASVHEQAAQYLGIPTVLVLVMAKKIGLPEFVWPARDALDMRVERELKRMRQNPFLGAFVPEELAATSPAVQLFVVFLFHEIEGRGADGDSNWRWLRALHQAAVGDLHAQLELDTLRQQAGERTGIF